MSRRYVYVTCGLPEAACSRRKVCLGTAVTRPVLWRKSRCSPLEGAMRKDKRMVSFLRFCGRGSQPNRGISSAPFEVGCFSVTLSWRGLSSRRTRRVSLFDRLKFSPSSTCGNFKGEFEPWSEVSKNCRVIK
uniref:Uncharacterized protein n=1 Tax=Anguilla anguilla TaxID=7936 RepID=A0A0E9XH13_ANGAN